MKPFLTIFYLSSNKCTMQFVFKDVLNWHMYNYIETNLVTVSDLKNLAHSTLSHSITLVAEGES